jgi:hypothetical protein
MIIPQCLQRDSGDFDVEEVERLLGERCDVLLAPAPKSGEPEILVPFDKMQPPIHARVRQYLAEKAARQRPLNGAAMSSGKLAAKMAPSLVPAARLVPKARNAPVTTVTLSVTQTPPSVTDVTDGVTKPKTNAERQRAYRERHKDDGK